MRRALAEAGETLGWAEVAAIKPDPIKAVRADVRKMVQSGVRSLKRSVEAELAEKEAEAEEFATVLETVQGLAEGPEDAFPQEITFHRTAKAATASFKTSTETLSINDADEAAKAVRKLEKSAPRWERLRQSAITELNERQETLSLVGQNLSDVLDGWRGLMKEVLIVMH